MTLQEKVHVVMKAQADVLVSRDAEIKGVWLTMLSGEHGFFHGVPGIAKSLIVSDMARYFPDSTYFHHLMGKHTAPEELFGPVSISALRDDRYEYNTHKYLPEATFAFLDEAFKSNGAILNSLLMLMNERLFRNGTEVLKVPLQSLFIASNEIPTESELAAMYDRILFRFNVEDLKRSEDFLLLLQREDKIAEFLKADPVVTFSPEEYTELRDEVSKVVITNAVKEFVVDIRDNLQSKHQIYASPRRWLKTLKGIRAHAYLAGRAEATAEDLIPLTYMLWSHVDQIPQVLEVVWEIANPTLYILNFFRDEITALLTQMEDALKQGDVTAHADNLFAEYGSKIQELEGRIAVSLMQLPATEKSKYEDKFIYMGNVLRSANFTLGASIGGITLGNPDNHFAWEPEKIG